MKLDQAIAAIDTIPVPNSSRTPQRFRELLDHSGISLASLSFILVGGTNGKGSTTAMLASVLRSAGIDVGRLVKPHVHRFNERCTFNEDDIDDASLIRLVRELSRRVQGWTDEYGEPIRPPELRYLVWLGYLLERRPQIVVCEVNEGGRYDVTSVLPAVLAVITDVGLDHVATLGPSIRTIAWHKAGIIQRERPVVTGCSGQALEAIEAEVQKKRAPLMRLHHEIKILRAASGLDSTTASIEVAGTLYDVATPLLGAFQVRNLAVAVGAAHQMHQMGWLDSQAIAAGLARATLPGRFEIVDDDPPTVLDGAHNSDKAAALVSALRSLYEDRPLVFVVSTAAERVPDVVPPLAAAAHAFVATQSGFSRAASTAELLEASRGLARHVYEEARVPAAVALARSIARAEGGVVVVTGALITLGEAQVDSAAGASLKEDR